MLNILTWNILAKKYATTDIRGFPFVDPAVLTKEHRLKKILEVLKAGDYDVICLQEADFADEIVLDGYEGLSILDDLCIIYKKTLVLEGCGVYYFKDLCNEPSMSQGALCFSFLIDEKPFMIATTHLKAKEGFETVRHKQASALIETYGNFDGPVFIVGDFNETLNNPACQEMMNAGFSSSYEGFTTIKKRQELVKMQIDYIWYKHCSMVESYTLNVEIPDIGLPSVDWPSDHLALVGKFNI
jgi:mRNA deadenylase 3'-5' endonuclease subunit Ccr4